MKKSFLKYGVIAMGIIALLVLGYIIQRQQEATILPKDPVVRIDDPSTLLPIRDSIFSQSTIVYHVGTLQGGKYDEGELFILSAWWVHWDDVASIYLIKKENNFIIPAYYSGSLEVLERQGLDTSRFILDRTFRISDLEIKRELYDAQHDMTLILLNYRLEDPSIWIAEEFFSPTPEQRILFTDEQAGPVFMDPTLYTDEFISETNRTGVSSVNGFYTRRKDGTRIDYMMKIPFVDYEKNIPLFTWSDGTENSDEYTWQTLGGCGPQDYLAIGRVTLEDLVPAGTTRTGDTIYMFANSDHKTLQNLFDQTWKGPDNDLTYDDFLSIRPIFFWQDPFGRFVQFQNNEIGPAAECGKPVIYLYPEKKTRVSVKVNPLGGMTVSDPFYGEGWKVVAHPDGTLVERSSGKIYPYLFWEGTGSFYTTPEEGWVVPREDVYTFLDEKLALFGLQGREITDFQDFWEPKMQSSPYYFVTFVGTGGMDRIAPLTIDPTPDTVIRILMDFTPLDEWKDVTPPDIHTPLRTGFTVIEWGGVLR